MKTERTKNTERFSETNIRRNATIRLVKFEGLALEVAAKNAGLMIVKPAVLHGKSGVDHKFDGLVSDGPRFYAFDFYESVDEIDVLRTYIKKYDSGASTNMVCTSGKITPNAASLAREYGVEILGPEGLGPFFQPLAMASREVGQRAAIA